MAVARKLAVRRILLVDDRVMCCDEAIMPLQERIEAAGDLAEVEEVYNTERQLLYVACTRARDCLLVTSGGSPSEFLRDMDPAQ